MFPLGRIAWAVGVGWLVLGALVREAGPAAPGRLVAAWESSAGNHAKEQICSYRADGKVAYFYDSAGKAFVARDTTTWKKLGPAPADVAHPPHGIDAEKAFTKDGTLGARLEGVWKDGAWSTSRIVFFHPRTTQTITTVDTHPVYMQSVLAFSQDGAMLASASSDGVILWDAQKKQKIRFMEDAETHRPTSMVFSPDGKTLAVNAWQKVVFWDTATGQRKLTLGGHIAQIWNVAIAPDGSQIVTVGNDPQLIYWDPQTGLNFNKIPLETAHLMAPVCFSPDGKRIAVGDRAVVRIFDAQSRKLLHELRGHTTSVQTLAFHRDGKQLASGSGGVSWIDDVPTADKGEIILWDISNSRALHTLPSGGSGVNALVYSPDGTTLLTGCGMGPDGLVQGIAKEREAIGVWDSVTGKHLRWLPVDKNGYVTALAFTPDGKQIAHNGCDGSQIQLLDAKTGAEIRKFSLRNRAAALAFSRDGTKLAAVGAAGGNESGQGFLQLFDVLRGNCLATHFAHKESANCVAFAPDGQTLVTGGSDSVLWKWKLVE